MASAGTSPYSTILMTFTNVLEIKYVSFINLLPDGFGRSGAIVH